VKSADNETGGGYFSTEKLRQNLYKLTQVRLMFLKMTGKLLFKACIPLVIVAGISTYVMSQRGVDPVLMWKGIGSGVMNQFASLFSNVKDDASKAADAVAGVTSGLSTESPSKRTKVFTWKDAEGVTQLSRRDRLKASLIMLKKGTTICHRAISDEIVRKENERAKNLTVIPGCKT